MCRRPTKRKAVMNNGTSGSLVRIQLLTLFHRNPGLKGTCDELADAIGRDPDTVAEQARKLTHLRILEEVEVEGGYAYRYLPPRAVSGIGAGESGYPEAN